MNTLTIHDVVPQNFIVPSANKEITLIAPSLDNAALEHTILPTPSSAYLAKVFAEMRKVFPYRKMCPHCSALALRVKGAKALKTCKNKHLFSAKTAIANRNIVNARRARHALMALKGIYPYRTVKAYLRKISFNRDERFVLSFLHNNRETHSRYEPSMLMRLAHKDEDKELIANEILGLRE